MTSVLFSVFLLLQAAAPPSGVKVSGKVTRAQTEASQTQVRLMSARNGDAQYAEIAADGSFQFFNVQPGAYQLVAGPSTTMQPLAVTVADKDINGVDLRMIQTAAVTGSIAVEGSAPRPRFQLRFAPVDPASLNSAPVTTAAGGPAFTVRLPAGEYRVTASDLPAGYAVKSMASSGADLTSQILKISSGSDSVQIAIALGVSSPPPWVRVAGHVTGGGDRSPTATVQMTGASVADIISASVKPDDGSFEFQMVPPGNYTARVVPVLNGFSSPIPVAVGNKDVFDVELPVPATREVKGRVAIEGDGPLPSAIGFNVSGANIGSEVRPDGTFSLVLPAEGQRPIKLAAGLIPPGYMVKSLTYGSADLLKNPLQIISGESQELLVTYDTARATFEKVSGRVLGAAPGPVEGEVALGPQSGGVAALQVPISPDGTFVFPKVLQGSYTAYTTAPGTVASARITVASVAVTGVQLVTPHEVTGRVSVEGGAPDPSSFTLPLVPTTQLTIRPQIDGGFRVQLPPGEYRVGAPWGLPPGYSLKSIMYGGADLLRTPLKISPGDSAELLITLTIQGPPPGVSVSGRVTGLPPGQFRRVALREPTGGDISAALETSIGADGAFTFPKVLPGNYIVYLRLRAQSQVTVGDKDVTGVTVAWPSDILVSGHVIVDGPQTVSPTVLMEGKGPAGTSQSRATTAFILSLGKGDNTISVRNIPEAYRLKSITYGDVDLQKEPLKLDGPAFWDIIVRLAPKN